MYVDEPPKDGNIPDFNISKIDICPFRADQRSYRLFQSDFSKDIHQRSRLLCFTQNDHTGQTGFKICPFIKWAQYFTILEGSLKPVKELIKSMGGDSESLELRVSEEELVYKFRFAFLESDVDFNLVQENMAIDQEVIFKFGKLANNVCSKEWKTMPLESMDSRTDWVVILTDDAEAYLNEINAIVTKMKHPITCFVIDLHLCANYKHLQKLWDNYIMTDKESVGILLNFIHHHLVNPSRISFSIQEFREYSVTYPLVRAVSTEIGKKVTIDSNAKAIYYGLCFELNCEFADSYMNTFNENLDEMSEDIGLQWSIQNSTDNVVEVLYLYEPKV